MQILKRYYKYFTLAFATFFFDQIIKYVWPKFFLLGESYYLTDKLSLTHIRNYGIIGEKYSQYPIGQIEAYTLYWPFFLLLLLCLMAKSRFNKTNFIERLGYTLMVSGGASNLVDHWLRQHVIDTFRIDWSEKMSQPFNFADMLLLMGATILVMRLIGLWFQSQGKTMTSPLVDADYWTAKEER